MKKFITNSPQETKKLAGNLARKLKGGIIALSGDLGTGKTTFVQGFAKGLGIKDKIISPTFVLIRQHKIPKSSRTLYHIDLYRIEGVDSKKLGLEDIWSNPANITLIEWAEKIEELPKNTIKISIIKKGTNKRVLSIHKS